MGNDNSSAPTLSSPGSTRQESSSSYDNDLENFRKIKLLHSTYHETFSDRKSQTCDDTLQEFASIFIERTFKKFFDALNIDVDLEEEINRLNAEIDKVCIFEQLKCWRKWWCYLPHERRYLILYIATRCSGLYEYDPDWRSPFDRRYRNYAINVSSLNVPILLSTMRNCTLFDNVHGHVDKIVNAYLEYYNNGQEQMFVNTMKTEMEAFLDKIDDTLLAGKDRFLQQLELDRHVDSNFVRRSEITQKDTPNVQDAKVSSVVKDLQNPAYINWIKGTLTLKYLNKGAQCFSRMKFENFQRELPQNGLHFEDGEYIKKMCEQVEWKAGKWRYPEYKTHCDLCKEFFDNVVERHQRVSGKGGFNNCKDILVGGPWGIAKLFMPKNCGDVRTPEDTDTSALFKLILNCDLFHKCISYAYVDQIIYIRNKMMHSSDCSMAENHLEELYDNALHFLEEAISQADGTVRQELISSKENITDIKASVTTVDSFLERGQTAIAFQCNELEKVTDRKDNYASKQRLRRQIQDLKNKQDCYIEVEKSPSLRIQFRNVVLDTNMQRIHELREQVKALEKKNEALESKLYKWIGYDWKTGKYIKTENRRYNSF